jgi:hypothetical protein
MLGRRRSNSIRIVRWSGLRAKPMARLQAVVVLPQPIVGEVMASRVQPFLRIVSRILVRRISKGAQRPASAVTIRFVPAPWPRSARRGRSACQSASVSDRHGAAPARPDTVGGLGPRWSLRRRRATVTAVRRCPRAVHALSAGLSEVFPCRYLLRCLLRPGRAGTARPWPVGRGDVIGVDRPEPGGQARHHQKQAAARSPNRLKRSVRVEM